MLLIKELDDTKMELIKKLIQGVLNSSKNGCEVSIKAYKKKRTSPQNRFLWAVYKRIVEFCDETGFRPDNLNLKFINSDFLHEYFKVRFDVRSTTKFSVDEIMVYTDKIQDLMVQQSFGEYQPIFPPEREFQEF